MLSVGNNYISPIFTLHMKTYGVDEEVSSLLLGSITISYVLFIFFFVPAICKFIDKKVVIIMGILVSSLGVASIAPILLPNRWWVMGVGLPLMGIGNALCILPAIPQYVEFLVAVFP
jgi:MFS family permease